MLTREAAIERLRTTGTLASTALPKSVITADQARDPTARAIAAILKANRATRAPRCLAPAANQSVLP